MKKYNTISGMPKFFNHQHEGPKAFDESEQKDLDKAIGKPGPFEQALINVKTGKTKAPYSFDLWKVMKQSAQQEARETGDYSELRSLRDVEKKHRRAMSKPSARQKLDALTPKKKVLADNFNVDVSGISPLTRDILDYEASIKKRKEESKPIVKPVKPEPKGIEAVFDSDVMFRRKNGMDF